MSLEDEFVRDTRAMERIASALERWATIAEKRFEKEFPEPRPKRDVELIRSDATERAEQYGDKPPDGWLDETPKEAEPSRFQKRLEEAGPKAAPKGRGRASKVPEGDGNQAKPS
jgi:hypothetical protein